MIKTENIGSARIILELSKLSGFIHEGADKKGCRPEANKVGLSDRDRYQENLVIKKSKFDEKF